MAAPSLGPRWWHWAVCAHIYSLPQDPEHQQADPSASLGSLAFQGRARHHHHNSPIRNDLQPRRIQAHWEQALWVCSDTMRLVLFPFPLYRWNPLRHRELDSLSVTPLRRGQAGTGTRVFRGCTLNHQVSQPLVNTGKMDGHRQFVGPKVCKKTGKDGRTQQVGTSLSPK